jgi:hypothetical protein
MNKTDSIARRILGWALNRWDRWYDCEKGIYIHESEFQPEQNLGHAMLIVQRLEQFGFKFKANGDSEVSFNGVRGTGETLSQAITDAAYSLIEKHADLDSTRVWQPLV